MPISKKIINEIDKLNISDKEKDLLIKILELEDAGAHNYKTPYEKEINEYINSLKEV